MPNIPQETIEQIIATTDIVDLISSYFPLKRAGSNFKANCPFHNENSPSFMVNPSLQSFKCFGCGEGGSAIGFVMKYENLPFVDAVTKLAARVNVPIIEEAYDPKAEKRRRHRSRLLELHNAAAKYFHELLLHDPAAAHAREYLKSRGYGSKMAKNWLVGWIPENPDQFLTWAKEKEFTGREIINSGIGSLRDEGNPHSGIFLRFRDRLMFPINNDYGDIIAFSGRQLREDPRTGKYINSPETLLFKKSKVIFALDRARRAMMKAGHTLLCEGQIDSIACHENGIENAVAPLGTAFTSEHAKLLKRYTKNIIICFDSDKAGITAVSRAFSELAPVGLNVRVIQMNEGDDPDSYIKKNGLEAFQQLITSAVDFFDFSINIAEKNNQLNSANEKSDFVRNLAEHLSIIPDKASKEGIAQHIAVRLKLSPQAIQESIANVRKRPTRQYKLGSDDQTIRLEPTPLDRSVAALCYISIHSQTAKEWLIQQSETIAECTATLDGSSLLQFILNRNPDISSVAKLQTFLSTLPEENQLALRNLPNTPLPENTIEMANEILSFLSVKSIKRQIHILNSQLAIEELPAEKQSDIHKEVLDLMGLLHKIPARFQNSGL